MHTIVVLMALMASTKEFSWEPYNVAPFSTMQQCLDQKREVEKAPPTDEHGITEQLRCVRFAPEKSAGKK